MKLRLFCAIPIPTEVEKQLEKAIESLRSTLSPRPISWVKPGNFHLTLSFLGGVEGSRLPDLLQALEDASAPCHPFYLESRGLDCFPNASRARVLWAGLQEEGDQLARLQKRVALACAPFAERQEEGRFHAHITLGRFRSTTKPDPAQRSLLEQLIEANHARSYGRWPVARAELICSDLSGNSPHYRVLHRLELDDSPSPSVSE